MGIEDAPAACRTCAFLVKCFVQDAAALAERPAVVPEGWISHPVTVGGIPTRVIRVPGEGLPVVLLHGEGGSADRWIWNLNAFARAGFDVHAPDLPHHGFATRWGPAPSVTHYADFLEAYLVALGRPALVVAASTSANAAALVAARRGDLVAGLVLIGGGPLAYGEDWRGRLKRLAFYRSREGGRERLRRAVFDPRLAAPAMVEQEFRFLSMPGGAEAMAELSRHIGEEIDTFAPDAAGWARLANLPVLILWGEKDSQVPVAYAHRLQAHLGARAELTVLPEAGHLPNYEQPGAVNQRILRFAEALTDGLKVENRLLA